MNSDVMADAHFLLPEAVREVAQVVGLQATLRLVSALCPASSDKKSSSTSGRVGVAYVPRALSGIAFERLANIVGAETARALCREFGGEYLRMPACTAFTNRVRDASVRGYWRDSTLSARWIGWLHDLTERQVRNICRGELRTVLRASSRNATGARDVPPL